MKRKIHEVPYKGRHCSCDFWVLCAAVSKVTILGHSVSSVGRAYIIHRRGLTKNREDKRIFDGQTQQAWTSQGRVIEIVELESGSVKLADPKYEDEGVVSGGV